MHCNTYRLSVVTFNRRYEYTRACVVMPSSSPFRCNDLSYCISHYFYSSPSLPLSPALGPFDSPATFYATGVTILLVISLSLCPSLCTLRAGRSSFSFLLHRSSDTYTRLTVLSCPSFISLSFHRAKSGVPSTHPSARGALHCNLLSLYLSHSLSLALFVSSSLRHLTTAAITLPSLRCTFAYQLHTRPL